MFVQVAGQHGNLLVSKPRKFVSLVFVAKFALIVGLFLSKSLALSQVPNLSQMVHVSWTARDGAPQSIRALAQASDGTLWIGSDGGLFKFDGTSFQAFQPPTGEPRLPSDGILSVCTLKDGTVWVGMYLGGAARIANGRVTLYAKVDGDPLSVVDHLQSAPDGSVWALNNRTSLVRFGADGAWHQQETPLGPTGGRIFAFFIDRLGTVWIGQGGSLYRRPAAAASYTVTAGKVDFMVGATEASDGTIWIADVDLKVDKGRLQHLNREGSLIASLSPTDEAYSILSVTDGSLWLATQFNGIDRLHGEELGGHTSSVAGRREDRFTHIDGLSANGTTAMLSDQDGNIWIGSLRGIDRFSEAILRPFVFSTPEAGWFACSDVEGSLWVGSAKKQLYKLSATATRSYPNAGDIFSVSCGRAGDVWVMDHAGLWAVDHDQLKHLPPVPGTGPFAVRQVTETRDHQLFVGGGTGLQNLWTYKDGKWSTLPGPSPLNQAPLAVFVDSQDRLWAGYKDGRIGLPQSGKVLSGDPPGLGVVYAFLETSQGMLAAGMNGIAYLQDETFRMLRFNDQVSTRGLTGLVQSNNGDLWLNGSRGIVRVPFKEFAASLGDPTYRMKSENFSEGDFAGPSMLTAATPSAARDAGGKLWFSMLNGLISIDPDHLHLQSHLPSPSVRSMVADGVPVDTNASIPPKPQTLIIRYLAVNLTAPEKVVYKYKMEGLDETWQNAEHRTEAIYTHLRPGGYVFWVMASNGGDVWTAPVASVRFEVLPSFYQTWWFIAFCGLVAVLTLWLIFTLRVRYIASNMRARFQERVDERVRIARDLHDTLLQGVQGLFLSVHVAAQKVPAKSDSRILLERALVMADKIVVEGRNRVTRLRCELLTDEELMEHLQRVGEDLMFDRLLHYEVRRIGTSAALRPHIVDEVSSIAREALTNAFRHSQASIVEVILDYQERCFVLTCKDNGCGFDEEQGRSASKQGHWGLRGMTERAERIGGHCFCRSSAGNGTEIGISVPSSEAYIRRNWFRGLMRKVLPAKSSDDRPCE